MAKNKNETSQLLEVIINSIQEKKADEIVSLYLENIPNSICSYFVICQAKSSTQVNAIADSVLEMVKKETGLSPINKEGFENSEWILIDYFDIVVHVFQENSRNFYQLEKLWADAEIKKYD
ncbi:MAG: ribosome silencing factor [Saprospiraceae bacterium]|nr:ribosome silencing factor [Saprospiraceae bacterium]